MEMLTYTRLTQCTKAQLWDLHFECIDLLRTLPSDSPMRPFAVQNYHLIQLFLNRRSPKPTM